MFKKTLSIIALVFIASACSHIPLSTMLKMSTFDVEDFVDLNAEDIRAKITTNISNKFTQDETYLTFVLQNPKQTIKKKLPLVIISDEVSIQEHWFKEDTLKHVTEFTLSPIAVERFKEIQQLPELKNREKNTKIRLKISWDLQHSEQLKNYSLSAALLFFPEDGYFTLIEDYEFKSDK